MKCTENEEKGPKSVHFGEAMYKMQKREAEFPATDLAFGGKLRKDNRWVQLAELIPWDYIEEKYAALCQASSHLIRQSSDESLVLFRGRD